MLCSALALGALLLTSISCNAQLASDGWPKFRGNTRNTGLSASTAPGLGSLDWTFTAGGEIPSSPAVGPNGVIYFACRDRYLYAVNPDGTLAWRYYINSYSAGSSPAIGADGTVYVGSDDYYLYAVNSDGTLKWRKSIGGTISAPPAIGPNGLIYFGSSNRKIYGLNPDGTVNWSYTPAGHVTSCAAVGPDGKVYFTSKDSKLYVMSPAGALLWSYQTSTWIESSPALSDAGMLFFGNDGGRLYAVPTSGSGVQSYAVGAMIKSSPAIGPDGTVYVGADDGYLYALQPDLTLKWRYLTGGAIRSSPVVGSDGVVYVGSQDRYIYAVNPDGTLRWRHLTGGHVDASMAIGRWGRLYATSLDGKLYAFESDLTPPSTPVVADDGDFSTSAGSLHASWSASDPETGIAEFLYAIGTQPGSEDLLGWTSAATDTEITREGLILDNGTTYFFSVKARNGTGLWSEIGVSDGIRVDFTAPTVPVIADDGRFTSSADTLHATWNASDPETGVVEFEYRIGIQPGVGDVTAWASTGSSIEVTRTDLTLNSGCTYYFEVRARNAAGLWSEAGTSDGIMVDLTPPNVPVVTDDGEYSTDADSLRASWTAADPESGIAEYEYSIGTSPGSADLVAWTSAGTQTEATAAGLSLADGVICYFSVRAKNAVGMWSETGSSDGITVDLSAPSVPVVTDDGDFTYSFETLHAAWHSDDAQSGVEEYSYTIGTYPGGTDVADWTSAGSASEVTRTGLSLTDNIPYYFAVRARNGAGLWSDAGVSDGITCIPGSAWPKFRADTRNQGASDYPGSQHGALLWQFPTLGWVESSPAIAGDGTVYIGSGDGGLYAIAPDGGMQWVFDAGGSVDSCPTIGPHAEIYFGSYDGNLYCIGANGAFKWSYQTGDMIWSSPVVGEDGTIYVGSHDGSLYAVRTDGTLRWSYATTSPIWSSPALSDDGAVYFGGGDGWMYAVYADTGALKWKYRTDTAIDSSPAVAADGTVYAGSGDLYFYALRPDGTLKWRFFTGWPTDSSAAIGPDGTVYVGAGHNWTHGMLYAINPNGTMKWSYEVAGEVRSSPAIDADGTVYFGAGDGYVYALSSDGALKWRHHTGAAVLSSPAIGRDGTVCVGSSTGSVYAFRDDSTGDDTPPTRPVVADEGAATLSTGTLAASWKSSDPESGVVEYEYAIGVLPATDGVATWTSVGNATSVTREDLHLVPGTVYYFSVKARNGARMWSPIGVSDGILAVCADDVRCIGSAEELQDGTLIYLTGKVVTAAFADCFYVEETDRSAGIKVIPNGLQIPAEGTSVSLTGRLATDNGEAAVSLTTLHCDGSSPLPRPVGLLARTACMGPQADIRPGVAPGCGLEAIGLLVTIRGRITASNTESFYLDDNSGVTDPSGIAGIKARAQGLSPGRSIAPPATGNWYRVTGVLSVEKVGTTFRRVIRPRSQADILPI